MAKVPQIRIYADKPLQDFLAVRPVKPCWHSTARCELRGTRDDAEVITENVAINRLAERHQWLMRNVMPQLSDGTWLALLNACENFTELTAGEIESIDLAGCIIDDVRVTYRDDESAGDFFDRAELMTGAELWKLIALRPAEKLAVIEGIERWWGRDHADTNWRRIVENKDTK